MTSTPRSVSRVSRRSRLVGSALGVALAAGLIAPAAASAAPASVNVAPVVPAAAHTARIPAAPLGSTVAGAGRTAGGTKTVRTVRTATKATKATKAVAYRRVALSTAEARMLQLVNGQRTAHHLVPLVAAAGPTDVARAWSIALAAAGTLSHNPDLVPLLQGAGGGSWHWLAENVGVAPVGATDELFAAYMASPHHRANILDPRARFIGMGTVTDAAGTSWNTMDFIDSYNDSYGPARTRPAV